MSKYEQALQDAIDELEKHGSLELIDKLHDCQQPKWERLLKNLVTEITDKTVMY